MFSGAHYTILYRHRKKFQSNIVNLKHKRVEIMSQSITLDHVLAKLFR